MLIVLSLPDDANTLHTVLLSFRFFSRLESQNAMHCCKIAFKSIMLFLEIIGLLGKKGGEGESGGYI